MRVITITIEGSQVRLRTERADAGSARPGPACEGKTTKLQILQQCRVCEVLPSCRRGAEERGLTGPYAGRLYKDGQIVPVLNW
jgi:hypothetical protein